MTHNTREVEEGVDAVFQAVMSDLKAKYRVSDTLSDVLSDSLSKHLTEAITTLYQEVDHQLQKARHDWLREEIGRLERMKEKQQVVSVYKNFRDDIYGYNLALQTIIDRYQAELDQDNK